MFLTFDDQYGSEVNVITPCPLRGAIYRDHLREALTKFQNYSLLSGDFYFKALCDPKLLSVLACILDKYLLKPTEMMLKSPEGMLLSHDEYLKRFDADHPTMFSLQTVARATDPEAIEEFRRQFPLMAYAMKRVTQLFSDYMIDVCKKIQDDLLDIQKAFFNNAKIRSLRRIEGTSSDLHKGCKQVVILHFEVDDNTRAQGRVVFKPSDIEVDYLLVGDSEHVAYNGEKYKVGGQPTFHSVSKMLNDIFFESKIELRLPTYTILPRVHGSSLVANGQNQLPIRDCYGYIQFLSNDPDFDKETGQPITEGMAEDNRPWDWIGADETAAKSYFKQGGALIAMSEIFRISDMHLENVIVHERQPHLIDLEISFKHSVTDLDKVDLGTHGLDREKMTTKTTTLSLKRNGWETDGQEEDKWGRNRLRMKDGTIAKLGKYSDDVIDGYKTAIEAFKRGRKSFIQLLKNEPVRNLIARAIPYSTAIWAGAMEIFLDEKCDYHAGNDNAMEDLETEPVVHMKEIFANYLNGGKAPESSSSKNEWEEPRWIAMQTNAGLRDLYECDIPTFYHRVSEIYILNSRGEILHEHGPYFQVSAIELIINKLQEL